MKTPRVHKKLLSVLGRRPKHTTPRKPEMDVALADGLTGSRFLHGALVAAVEAFPQTFAPNTVASDAKAFRADLVQASARFEALRIESPERFAIAKFLAEWAADRMVFRDEAGTTPLADFLAAAGDDGATLREVSRGERPDPAGWMAVPFQAGVFRGAEVAKLAEKLYRAHEMSTDAHEALKRAAAKGEAGFPLKGARFAILGAGAELAPTALLLEGGADVLWIDRAEPEPWLQASFGSRPVAGRLFVSEGGACLLSKPREALAAIRAFYDTGDKTPVHLGLFAYAPGSGRELRLTGAMDQIVRALEPASVASISMYVSPTTPGEVTAEDQAISERRLTHPPLWQRSLLAVGGLGGPPFSKGPRGDKAVAHAVVMLQGPTYLAAQYLSKMMAAEALAHEAAGSDSSRSGLRVSANVAGITNTRSLEHPLFQAAFVGAPSLGVHIFKSETTRTLSAILMLEDIFGVEAPALDVMARRQIHGGVYTHPFLFERTIRVGAVIGLSKKPKLILKMKR